MRFFSIVPHMWQESAEHLSQVVCKTTGYSDGTVITVCHEVIGYLHWLDGWRIIF